MLAVVNCAGVTRTALLTRVLVSLVLVSFVVAYATVAWLLRYVARHSIAVFVWYRWALGAALIVALATGWISAT